MMFKAQKGGLLRRKKQTAEDKAFTPERVQQRVKEYEEVKNRKKPEQKPATAAAPKPAEKYDENKGLTFDQAFAKARKAGDGMFKWNGRMYGTDMKKQAGGKIGHGEMRKAPKDWDKLKNDGMNPRPITPKKPIKTNMPINKPKRNYGVLMPTGNPIGPKSTVIPK